MLGLSTGINAFSISFIPDFLEVLVENGRTIKRNFGKGRKT
jgi:protoheme ferro-lyase